MWVAREKNKKLSLFHTFPERYKRLPDDNKYAGWYHGCKSNGDDTFLCEIDASLFPDLKWEDDPVEVKLVSINESK